MIPYFKNTDNVALSHSEASSPPLTCYQRFWATIYERQSIWHKRFVLKLPPPWTSDPLFQKYSFTNIYRELDRGTIYYKDRILRPLLCESDPATTLVGTIAYRFFNRVDTWDSCLYDFGRIGWDPNLYRTRLKTTNAKRSVFSICTRMGSWQTGVGSDLVERIVDTIDYLYKNKDSLLEELMSSASPREAFNVLCSFPEVGTFLAWEIYSDLLYAEGEFFPWTENDWAYAGPGAQIGLEMIWKRQHPIPWMSLDWYLEGLRALQDDQKDSMRKLGLDFSSVCLEGKETLSLRNLEHWCCEFQKYEHGRTRRKFKCQVTV